MPVTSVVVAARFTSEVYTLPATALRNPVKEPSVRPWLVVVPVTLRVRIEEEALVVVESVLVPIAVKVLLAVREEVAVSAPMTEEYAVRRLVKVLSPAMIWVVVERMPSLVAVAIGMLKVCTPAVVEEVILKVVPDPRMD